MLEIFSSVFSFCQIKAFYKWKYTFYRLCVRNPDPGFLQFGCTLEKWQWRYDFLAWGHHCVFWCCFVSLFKFTCWSNFYVVITTGSGVMTNFFYKGLTRNPETGNTPVWVLPDIWRLVWVGNIKFVTNVSNNILLNAKKCQGYCFCLFLVIKGKPTGEGGDKIPPPHTHPTPPPPWWGLKHIDGNKIIRHSSDKPSNWIEIFTQLRSVQVTTLEPTITLVGPTLAQY